MEYIMMVEEEVGELDKLVNGTKNMIVRGFSSAKYKEVKVGDIFYFVSNHNRLLEWKAEVTDLFSFEGLTRLQAQDLIIKYQNHLNLTLKEAREWGNQKNLIFFQFGTLLKMPTISVPSFYQNQSWIALKNNYQSQVA